MVVICHEKHKAGPLLSFLALGDEVVRYSTAIKADLIFGDAFPVALGVLIVSISDSSTLAHALVRLEEVQKTFRNSMCVCVIRPEHTSLWNELQIKVPAGLLRLFLSRTNREALTSIKLMYEHFCTQKDKLKLMDEYFKSEERSIQQGTQVVQKICHEVFARLGVSSSDAAIVMDGFPTLRLLIQSDTSTLLNNSPASIDALQSIAAFFESLVLQSPLQAIDAGGGLGAGGGGGRGGGGGGGEGGGGGGGGGEGGRGGAGAFYP